eukprot:152547-Heterocapsa_arctica.AAC.1
MVDWAMEMDLAEFGRKELDLSFKQIMALLGEEHGQKTEGSVEPQKIMDIEDEAEKIKEVLADKVEKVGGIIPP